jgi:hypothetical protein
VGNPVDTGDSVVEQGGALGRRVALGQPFARIVHDMAAGLDAAARARWAARAADGGVRDSQFCMSSPATTAWCPRLDASAS